MLENITNTTNTKETKSQNFVTKPSANTDELEHYLFNIFEKELNTPDSVLLSYNPITIKCRHQ